jgi:hypothetical protein
LFNNVFYCYQGKGYKIGEIGPSFSLENGGYRSHLHLGIEKASIENAIIACYNDPISHWYNPMEFITEKNHSQEKYLHFLLLVYYHNVYGPSD